MMSVAKIVRAAVVAHPASKTVEDKCGVTPTSLATYIINQIECWITSVSAEAQLEIPAGKIFVFLIHILLVFVSLNVSLSAGVDAMYQRAMDVEFPIPEDADYCEMVSPLEVQQMHFSSGCESLHWYLVFAYAEDSLAAAASLGLSVFQYGSLKGICELGHVFGSLPHALAVRNMARMLQFRRRQI